MKFFSVLAASACAFFGASQAQTTTAPPTPLPACLLLNYTAVPANIASLNAVIDTANQLGYIQKLTAAYDPITVVNNRLDAIPFNILGTDFALTPIIKSLNATGISGVVPRHLTVTNDTTLQVFVDFNSTLAVKALFSFEISQPNRQWWQLCWVNLLDPAKCAPVSVDVSLDVALEKPTVGFNVTTGIQMCPKTAPKGTCSDVTVSSISIAALTGNFATLLPRILRKISYASLASLSLAVEKVQRLQFALPAASPLLKALGERILSFTTDELNKKGSLYNDAISILNSLGKTLINNLLGEELAPQFGNTCYNVGVAGA